MPPFEIQHIDHIVLRARNPALLSRFYIQTLGCRVERQLDIGLIQLRAGTCLIDIVDVDSQLGSAGGAAPAADGHNLDHFCLRVEPFDPTAAIEHLAEHGITVRGPVEVYGAQGFGLSLYFDDPEGNTVELKGPAIRPPVAAPDS
jgi:glyoxylase I family protein